MEPGVLEDLKERILSLYGSLHAFAKRRPGGLARSTIYQVFSSRYAGNLERQAERIRAALEDTQSGFFEILMKIGCARCRRKRRRTRQCQRCYSLWREQEAALKQAAGSR